MKKIIFIFFFLFVQNLFAGTIDPNVSDQKYIEYGSKFKNVVRIKGMCECKEKIEKHQFLASAVIIKPNWALTAAHVVKDTSDVSIISDNLSFPVKVFVHKEFEEKNFGHNDIALCYSEKDFNLDFYPELYSDSNEEGKTVSMAGYGITGNFFTGAHKSDGLKRGGSNKIERCERSVLVCTLNDKKTALEFLISSGDSGGGLFIGNELAGIHTFVMAADGKPNSNYGDESGHTRISLYREWILNKINEK